MSDSHPAVSASIQAHETSRDVRNTAVLDHKSESSSSKSSASNQTSVRDLILLTPYPVEPGHTLITIARLSSNEWKPDMRSNAAFVAQGDNAGIVINKPASIMDYNKIQTTQKDRQQPPNAKMSFKVFLINSETNKLTLEHRTLRFWLEHTQLIQPGDRVNNNVSSRNMKDAEESDDNVNRLKAMRSFANLKQESSQLAHAYFCQLTGSDEFPKNYVGFIMKLMRLLKRSQFERVVKMEVELRQLTSEEHKDKPPSSVCSVDSSQAGESGRGSPLTTQKVLDIIESSYPNPVSIKEICFTTQTDECIVRQLMDELANKDKINSTDNGLHYTRTTKSNDAKINMVKQMPKVKRSQQPIIAIITAQYCEKLAVDSMISDKETFVRYRVASGPQDATETSANYVYTLGNIGDHRVVSTKLTSIGNSRGALIAAGNATTRLLGTFPEIEYVFLVGCGGGVVNYTDFSSHVRLGDVVVSHLPAQETYDDTSMISSDAHNFSCHTNGCATTKLAPPNDFVYVHCRPKQQQNSAHRKSDTAKANIPVSYSIHRNLKRVASNGSPDSVSGGDDAASRQQTDDEQSDNASQHTVAGDALQASKTLTYNECHFRLWRPASLNLQELAERLWLQGIENPTQRIWDYYIDEGIKTLAQQDMDASRPAAETDKLFMSIGLNDTIEVNHPEAGDDELDLRRDGRPMCHFGPIGSGKPIFSNEQLRQQMVSEFGLRALDSEFDPVVESIYGNRKESYIMIRGISDYRDGRKRKEWQPYAALVAAAFMKSIIANMTPVA